MIGKILKTLKTRSHLSEYNSNTPESVHGLIIFFWDLLWTYRGEIVCLEGIDVHIKKECHNEMIKGIETYFNVCSFEYCNKKYCLVLIKIPAKYGSYYEFKFILTVNDEEVYISCFEKEDEDFLYMFKSSSLKILHFEEGAWISSFRMFIKQLSLVHQQNINEWAIKREISNIQETDLRKNMERIIIEKLKDK